MRKADKITTYDGDITKHNCGLSEEDLETIRSNVSIFIHAASSIHLKKGLDYMAQQLLHPSVAIAALARSCANLDLFIYVSTAFSSTFLRQGSRGSPDGLDAVIKEEVRPIRSDPASASMDVEAELSDLAAYGSTPEYRFVDHPFAYSYTKHLTERVIERDFKAAGLEDKLLIFRPSVIAPAAAKPYPFFERPGSAPTTLFAASCIAHPPSKMVFSTQLDSPSKALVDAIPIDIVVNRLIAHTAARTRGHVHAVAGEGNRLPTERLLEVCMMLRQPWWPKPTIEWRNEDWKSPSLCRLARLFVGAGAAFSFEDGKTKALWEKMDEAEQAEWPLFFDTRLLFDSKSMRAQGPNVKKLMAMSIKQSSLPKDMTVKFMCRSFS
ncbi:Fatty acyl-CoA reductase 1 [Escovopsis weberi]|uniref:Fatty acyl-CoA reductase n=1 Tax=Escovopsis weberi TaxID=150374 RepID=A0A0M8N1F0_ESCWE|nr:Fatty acyl-CoA reductase 1 [Escovopsis weberi]